jgi:hypothetical protein
MSDIPATAQRLVGRMHGQEERPEWVHCVMFTQGKSWCGKDVSIEWAFVSIDHAAHSGKNGSHNVACRECVSEIIEALNNGHGDPEYPPNVKNQVADK